MLPRILTCASALLFAVASSFALEPPLHLDSLITNCGTRADFPNASTLTVFGRSHISVDAKGASSARVEQCIKILDDRAKDEIGDRSVRYDENRDTVIFEQVWTRLPSGEWIMPEPDAFTVTSAPEVQWASAYSQLRQQNVSFPGLAEGAAIYWAYRIEPKPGREPWPDEYLDGVTQFGGFEPAREIMFSLTADTSYFLQYELQNDTREPEQSLDGSRRTLVWKYENTPQRTQEPDMVSTAHFLPRLVYTSFRDWADLGLYMGEYFWKSVEQSDTAITEFAKNFDPGNQNSQAIARRIALWVQQNIRTVPLGLGAVGYEPSAANQVWKNRYGDVRDKAVLLSALLGAYGVPTIPVLLQANNSPFSKLPVPAQFGHLALAVPVGDDTLFIDTTPRYAAPDEIPYSRTLGMACELILGQPLLLPAKEISPVERSAKTRMSVRLDSSGTLDGHAEALARGDFAVHARSNFADQKALERDIYFQQIASRIQQGTEVLATDNSDPKDVANPMRVSMDFSCADYAVKQDDLMLFELPANPFSFALSGFFPDLPEVKYPIDLPTEGATETVTIVTIPANYSISYLPNPLFVDNPYVHIELIPKKLEDRVEWTQLVAIKADIVPLEDYPLLRQSFESLTLPRNRLMVLEEK
ncbi:DUF3857 and transglutaminase domain-containing protein [bacterium]|nr:DUF3857 and transglutaminase domain-containing protein [bacterium]